MEGVPAAETTESETARVTRQIRDDIVDRVRVPGSKLVERDLAAELGVSRVPVREALKTLVAEGLVTLRPRTWAIVREFTPADVADLNEVRSALEVLTFRLAADRRSREGLGRLRAVLEREVAAAREDDDAAARRAAADFHETVTSIAGNDLLFEIDTLLRSRIRWLLVQHEKLQDVVTEHEALYQAIARRDVRSVSELILAHMGNIRYLDDPTWRDEDPVLRGAPHAADDSRPGR
ncbi:GntR family transcriptional regulator [Microbacterium kribbense]|uniref:GntR family transcriptional regulator n=1 Tax=Microbacterium kribbense TaxID=433645 RepID=A0ABP7GSM7_9MICO